MKQKRRYDITDALFEALQQGYEGVVKILFENSDDDVDAKIHTGWAALFIAAQFGHMATVELALNMERWISRVNHIPDGTPLCVAARYRYVKVVKLYLLLGVPIQRQRTVGETTLFDCKKWKRGGAGIIP